MEQLPYRRVEKRKLSRRALLAGGIGAVAAAALRKIPKDISFGKPPLDVDMIPAGRMAGDIDSSAEDGIHNVISITPGGKLLYEPSGLFFTPGKEFKYVHRGGNSLEAIYESYSKGGNLFDIDANDVHGNVRGEHGFIPQGTLRIGGLHLNLHIPVVLDVNEKEVKFGMPSGYEELIAYIASLSTPERPLAVSTELKRGQFDPSTIEKMFAIHQAYNVPVIMYSLDNERLVAIGNQLAAVYNIAK